MLGPTSSFKARTHSVAVGAVPHWCPGASEQHNSLSMSVMAEGSVSQVMDEEDEVGNSALAFLFLDFTVHPGTIQVDTAAIYK